MWQFPHLKRRHNNSINFTGQLQELIHANKCKVLKTQAGRLVELAVSFFFKWLNWSLVDTMSEKMLSP